MGLKRILTTLGIAAAIGSVGIAGYTGYKTDWFQEAVCANDVTPHLVVRASRVKNTLRGAHRGGDLQGLGCAAVSTERGVTPNNTFEGDILYMDIPGFCTEVR